MIPSWTADAAARTIFFGTFIASWLVEMYCGPDSKRCPLFETAVVPYPPHCAVAAERGGLGDPALSVGSLQFAAALPYLARRFSLLPIVSTFLGIASFLFHAHGTDVHHRLDLTGVVLLAPAVLDCVLAFAPLPLSSRAALFLVPLVLVLATYPRSLLLYSVSGVYTALILGVLWAKRDELTWPFLAGTVQLVVGIVLILVGNGDAYWTCIPSQLGEPHYWGHFFSAAGVTLISRGWPPRGPRGESLYSRL
jgi:hypothetical protein